MWIADSKRSRRIEQQSECEFGLTSHILMERAGTAVFDAIRDFVPEGGRVAILCGKGHNGGDGLVVARVALQHGYNVEVLLTCSEEEMAPLTAYQYNKAVEAGVQPLCCNSPQWQRSLDEIGSKDVVIDAILGIGAKREVHGKVKQCIQAINRSGVPVISVDVPSGICCDTGEELGDSVWALRTVTFGMAKPFLFQGMGLEHAGFWTVSEIGFPQVLLTEPCEARLLDGEWVASLLPERLRSSHKGDHGHVLIIAGSRRMRGAATLAALGALQSGAGLVTVASIPSVCDAVAANVPEAMLLPLPEEDGVISSIAVKTLLQHEHRFGSTLIGPGLTTEPQIMEFLTAFFQAWTLPCVVDADALNCVANGVQLPMTDCVLCPHPGEMSRLLHSSIAEIQADRFRTVRQATDQYKHTILLKGPYSIVGEPGQPNLVNCTGNAGQASAGMGDVLGGMIATLVGQDLPGYYAAGCAMFWHGAAADICCEELGPIGYRATDVAKMLPNARARIVSACMDR